MLVNDKTVMTILKNEHIIIPAQFLIQGTNSIAITGHSGDKALNRSDDYMYTLFVPDHARSVFPCFDQPHWISPLLVQSFRSTGSPALSILRRVLMWILCAMVLLE